MKKIWISMTCFLLAFGLFARMRVVTTYPYIQDITERIGQDGVKVIALSPGNWDPHVIIPKPSLIAQVRRADLLIINGAQLEIGWIPPVIRQANNPDVMPGKKGFLDLSNFVKLIQVPSGVSRAQGDIHPAGNPHFHLDPAHIPPVTRAIADKLMALDPDHAESYARNRDRFLEQWNAKLEEWDRKMAPLKGKQYVEFHKNLDYFLEHYGLIVLDTIEPLPGIPPTSKHTLELIDKLKNEEVAKILHDVYHSAKCTRLLSEKTGVPWVVMPHDVRSLEEVRDIIGLFDELVARLTK